nr:energy transducer TonB [Endobacter medicaginis]
MRRLRDDDRVLRRGLLYSAGAHLLVLLSLLIVLPVPKAPEPEEPPSVEMEFTGGSAATTPEKSEAKPVSKVAPVADPVPHEAQPSP